MPPLYVIEIYFSQLRLMQFRMRRVLQFYPSHLPNSDGGGSSGGGKLQSVRQWWMVVVTTVRRRRRCGAGGEYKEVAVVAVSRGNGPKLVPV